MELQFTEHNEGKKSTNPKVQKLDKLARLLKVEITIDGVKYGNIDENGSNKMVTPKVVVEKYANADENGSNTSSKMPSDSANTDTDNDNENKGEAETVDIDADADADAEKDNVSDTPSHPQTPQKTKKRGRPKKTT